MYAAYDVDGTAYHARIEGNKKNALPNQKYMFNGNKTAKTIVFRKGIDTSQAMNMNYMFYNCSVRNLDLSGFDTGSVENMRMVFYNCTALTSLDLSSFSTEKVIDMSSMFQESDKLTAIYVTEGKWIINDTCKVNSMLFHCGTSTVTYK